MKTAEQQRKSDLAKIHLAKKSCGMQDIEYRTLVQAVSKGRTDSAGEPDAPVTAAEEPTRVAVGRRYRPRARPQRARPGRVLQVHHRRR